MRPPNLWGIETPAAVAIEAPSVSTTRVNFGVLPVHAVILRTPIPRLTWCSSRSQNWRRRQFELTRVRQVAVSSKSASFHVQKQCLVPAPRKGRRPGYVLYAPWRGFDERPWFDALFHFRGPLMGRQRNPVRDKSHKLPVLDIDEWHPIIRSLGLSGRQGRIVELILQGKRDKQIAAELELSVHTIRTYMKRIFDKAGVDDRFELLLRIMAIRKSNCGQSRCPYK